MILRCTNRLLRLLRVRLAANPSFSPPSDDDWYANLVWLDRRKCLLLAHAGTLFPVFVADIRKADLVPTGPAVVRLITAAVADAHLRPDAVGALDPAAVTIARTASRVVLGYMNEMVRHCEYATLDAGGLHNLDVQSLNRELREAIHLSHEPPGFFVPIDLARSTTKPIQTAETRPPLRVLD